MKAVLPFKVKYNGVTYAEGVPFEIEGKDKEGMEKMGGKIYEENEVEHEAEQESYIADLTKEQLLQIVHAAQISVPAKATKELLVKIYREYLLVKALSPEEVNEILNKEEEAEDEELV